jgi:hypothetical protein
MDPKAITKAESRLRIAMKAAAELRQCNQYDVFTDTLYQFISAAKNIWTALEQGAKDTPQCRQWFGAKAKERRGDELLQYLFEARNDDEHGLEPVTVRVPGSLGIGVAKPGFSNSMVINSMNFDGAGRIAHFDAASLDGKPILIEETLPHAKLADIRPVGRPPMKPPTSHKGAPIASDAPSAVADLAVIYLAALVAEASARS